MTNAIKSPGASICALLIALALLMPPVGVLAASAPREVELSSLDLSHMSCGWGTPQIDRSITEAPMAIAGQRFSHGVGTHAGSVLHIALDGRTTRFSALVGVDDAAEGKGSVVFRVYASGKRLYDSGPMRGGDRARRVDVDLTGVKHVILVVTSGGDDIQFDHANWAQARFTVEGDAPKSVAPPREEAVIRTLVPGPEPRMHGPRVFGVRPGRPFVYRIPCTGTRPITFRAVDLPPGLTLDGRTGVVTGTAPDRPGEYLIRFEASSEHGSDRRTLNLIVGPTLALTPPMGWNSWYIHYNRVTEEHMREAARQMIASGMADVGYMYVNIDDCWMKKRGDEPYRDSDGDLLTNAKFPDIRGMVEAIHGLGLRAGTYISPGPWTCAGYVGSHEHEAADARWFADMGFDFLKYDWCSYGRVATGEGVERLQRPYRVMADLLKNQERDLVLNLCQYGMGEVWKWAGDLGGHCWRTTGDLGLEAGGSLPGFYHIARKNLVLWEYARPGAWNDPDYILIGWVGDARGMREGRPTPLTPNEQYSYMSLWSLMAAPLVFSGDMAKLDDFTLNVLCNPEIIEVDQDPLGRQGRPIVNDDDTIILAKPLADGSLAVGIFNLDEVERSIRVSWEQLGLDQPQRVRDLWRQRELGVYGESYETTLGRHDAEVIRLWPIKP